MARERFHPDVPRELDRYLLPTERIVFHVHRHWVVLLEPLLTVIAGVLVIGVVGGRVGGNPGRIMTILVAIWVLLVLRLVYEWFEWHHEQFLATDKRLMLVHGFLTRKVDIMPMGALTDMRYDRTMTGKFFGYGIYILESAGQDQALSRINYMPDPDKHYQQISAIIFAPPQRRLEDRIPPASTGTRVPISEPDSNWWRRG
jgi:hypothetical protein